jgi:hypothetical protein
VDAPKEPAVAWEQPEPAPATGPWETITTVNRFAGLGRIGRGVRTALADLKALRIDPCFEGPVEDPGAARAAEEEGVTEDRTPVLVLNLETADGLVRIAGVAVEQRGGATEKLLSCATGQLRGTNLPVPEARSGARHRLRFRLAPG